MMAVLRLTVVIFVLDIAVDVIFMVCVMYGTGPTHT